MQQFDDIKSCRDAIRQAQSAGKRVGLVPTMGALHDGHRSLIQRARAECDVVGVTIFVNPTQFAPGEDLDAYPRQLSQDLAICKQDGADIVFTPTVETMYPTDAVTTVHVASLTDKLCGAQRPGHFDGVTTVVSKLFHILPADASYFGEKDFQQLMVIRRMVRDLNLSIDIVACPTVRESDGLALSSRNAYLSPEHRRQAVCLSRALFAAREQVDTGECSSKAIVGRMRERIEAAGPVDIDYIDVVDPESLASVDEVRGEVRICVAARFGTGRLIDNIGVSSAV